MSYGIIRIQKFKAQAIRGIEIHDSREKPSRTNPDIDRTRTDLNYDLVECEDFKEAIQERLDTLKSTRAVRKDAVVMVQCLVTSDHDFFKDMPAARQREFFKQSLAFIADRYGKENILSATVHMDEKTPHMHVNFTPIRDRRLTAKTIFDRNELRGLQTDFHASVGQSWGLNRGESREEKVRHLDTAAYKLAARKKELEQEKERLHEQAVAAEKALQDMALPKVSFLSGKKPLQEHIEVLQGALSNKHLIEKENIELRTKVDDLTSSVSSLESKLLDEQQSFQKKRDELIKSNDWIRTELSARNTFLEDNPDIEKAFWTHRRAKEKEVPKEKPIIIPRKSIEELNRELIGDASAPKRVFPTPEEQLQKLEDDRVAKEAADKLKADRALVEQERPEVERTFLIVSVGNGKPEAERRAEAKLYADEWAALPAAERDAYKKRQTEALKIEVKKHRLEKGQGKSYGRGG